MRDLRSLCGQINFVWVVLDSLRFDVAQAAWEAGETPHLARRIRGWEKRHTPGNFTYAAHQAFFAGFLPTSGGEPRSLALAFEGSSTVSEETLMLEGSDVCEGLRKRGYRTTCIGGVGFFNKRTPLSRVLPGLFCESHWDPSLGVTDPRSTEHQVALACRLLEREGPQFLYLNVSATHQPNCHYIPGATKDSVETQRAALRYVDGALVPLWKCLEKRGACCWIFSDHGTAYGEDGYWGHRLSHPVVWEVPYAEFETGMEYRRNGRNLG